MRPRPPNVRAVSRPLTGSAVVRPADPEAHRLRLAAKAAEVARLLGTPDPAAKARRYGQSRAKGRPVRCLCPCRMTWPLVRDAAEAMGRSTPNIVACIQAGRPINGHRLEYAD